MHDLRPALIVALAILIGAVIIRTGSYVQLHVPSGSIVERQIVPYVGGESTVTTGSHGGSGTGMTNTGTGSGSTTEGTTGPGR